MIYLIGMGISFVVYIVLGLLISKRVKNANDYYVAGRNASVFLIVGSMIASYVSTGMFMGDAGEYYGGLFGPLTILATMQVVGYILGAVLIGRYLRRSEVMTLPQFFGKRFDSEKMRALSTVTAIITMCVYLLSVVMGIGTLMNLVTGLDYKICVLLGLVVFVFVTLVSGSKGVLITDTLMFSIFTSALIVSAFLIISKAGGWGNVVDQLVNHSDKQGLISWSGDLTYMYPSGAMNLIWGLVQGILWMSVCMVGPWQSSRYLMAKNEHTVIRSSVYSAFGIFALQFLVGIAAVAVNVFSPELASQSHVLIWAAKNVLPTLLGVILLTGVLAAGISSGTTFLSLVGSSVANDIFKGKGNTIRIGRISMLIVAVVVLLLGMFNPPQIFWVMYLGGAIIASSWMPVALASVLSKRVTKAGAFAGMLTGFLVCFSMKLISNLGGFSFPAYLDPTLVGIVANVLLMVIVSAVTKVTEQEKAARQQLFVTPESEKDPKEIKKTKAHLLAAIILGIVVTLILVFVWAIPVMTA